MRASQLAALAAAVAALTACSAVGSTPTATATGSNSATPSTGSGSATPSAVLTSPTQRPARVLGAGQIGTSGEVPWSAVGPGWVLATYTRYDLRSQVPRHEQQTLFLVDPLGGRYRLFTGTHPPEAAIHFDAWSPDHRRGLWVTTALQETGQHRIVDETDLTKGSESADRTVLSLPDHDMTVGYTRPTGAGLVIATTDRGGHGVLTRYDTDGRNPVVLLRGIGDASWLYSPDGASLVIGSAHPGSPVVVRNDGTLVRRLTDAPDACVPMRWWDPTTVLMSCIADAEGYHRLWLVHPADGSSRPLTSAPPKKHPNVDFGFADAWQLGSATYLQWTGDCGAASVRRLNTDGTVTEVTIAHSLGSDRIVASSGSTMLIWSSDGCDRTSSRSALLRWDAATGTTTDVLMPGPRELGVVAAIGAGNAGGHG